MQQQELKLSQRTAYILLTVVVVYNTSCTASMIMRAIPLWAMLKMRQNGEVVGAVKTCEAEPRPSQGRVADKPSLRNPPMMTMIMMLRLVRAFIQNHQLVKAYM